MNYYCFKLLILKNISKIKEIIIIEKKQNNIRIIYKNLYLLSSNIFLTKFYFNFSHKNQCNIRKLNSAVRYEFQDTVYSQIVNSLGDNLYEDNNAPPSS